MTPTNSYTVTTSKMNGSSTRFMNFNSFNKAYDYYLNKCNDENCIDNAEQSTGAEMNLTAGGVGYDYRIELTVNEESE